MKTFLDNLTTTLIALVIIIGASRTYVFNFFEFNINFSILIIQVTFILSCIQFAISRSIKIKVSVEMYLLVFFYFINIISSFYSNPNEYFEDKIFWLFAFNIVGICIIFLKNWDKDTINRLFNIFLYLSFIVMFVYLLASWIPGFPIREKVLDSYLGFSRASLFGFAVSINALLFFKPKLVHILHIIIYVIFSLTSGSRGSILALLLSIFAIVVMFVVNANIISKFFVRFSRFSIIILLFVVGLIVNLSFLESGRTFQRFLVLFEDNGGASVGGRFYRIDATLEYLSTFATPANFIFGCGFGCWASAVRGIDIDPIRDYPHVFLLEIFTETGFLGVITLLLSFVLLSLRIQKYLFSDFNLLVLYFTVFLFFVWSFTSGDFNDDFPISWFILILSLYKNNLLHSNHNLFSLTLKAANK